MGMLIRTIRIVKKIFDRKYLHASQKPGFQDGAQLLKLARLLTGGAPGWRQTCPAISAQTAHAGFTASLAGLHQRQHLGHRTARQALGQGSGKQAQQVVERAGPDRHGIDRAALTRDGSVALAVKPPAGLC